MAHYVAVNPPLRPGQRVWCSIGQHWTEHALAVQGEPFKYVCMAECDDYENA